jgi:hypothetical protein
MHLLLLFPSTTTSPHTHKTHLPVYHCLTSIVRTLH